MSYGPHTRNPWEDDRSEPEDESSPCGCGKSGCRIDGNDSTNVLINGRWFSSDCLGLCWNCGRVDALTNLWPIGGGRLVHDGCPTPAMEEDRVIASRVDEQRDEFNRSRR